MRKTAYGWEPGKEGGQRGLEILIGQSVSFPNEPQVLQARVSPPQNPDKPSNPLSQMVSSN